MCSQTVLLLLAVLALAGSARAQTVVDPDLTVSEVVPEGTLDLPTQVRFLGLGDLFVAEKDTGRIRRIQNGVVSATDALDLDVANENERGLLGLELHPNFPYTPFVYVYYSATTDGVDGGAWLHNRLSRFSWNGSTLDPDLELVLRVFGANADAGDIDSPNHNAGPILFGPDNRLYGTTGDLERDFAEQNNLAQPNVSALVGGIYRLNPNGSVPVDNPFVSNPNLAFRPWFAYGVRNSFGIAFDPLTGKLWDTENGPTRYDEINLVEPGMNSGWNEIMGPDSRDANGVGDLVHLPGSFYSDPEFSWFITDAPTGLAFLANSTLDADYRDGLLVGDANNGALYLFRLNAQRTGFVLSGGLADLVADDLAEHNQNRFGQGFGSITDIQIGPDGGVYVVSIGDGTIYKILPEPSFAATMAAGRWRCCSRGGCAAPRPERVS